MKCLRRFASPRWHRSHGSAAPLTLRDALRVLGLPHQSAAPPTAKELKQAYIRQTLLCHPDLFRHDTTAHERFHRLQDALALASQEVARGTGPSSSMSDDAGRPVSFATQLRAALGRHYALRDRLDAAAAVAGGLGQTAVGSLGEVASICASEARALAGIQRFSAELPRTLSGERVCLVETFVLFHPQYVRAMAMCVGRFQRDLPLVVRRVVRGRNRHLPISGLPKAARKDPHYAARFRQAATRTDDTVGTSKPGAGSGIDAMPMKPLVLVGALVFEHPKGEDDMQDGQDGQDGKDDTPKRRAGPASLGELRCAEELTCVLHPHDSIDAIADKMGAWEARSVERLRVELSMSDACATLSELLNMVAVPLFVRPQLQWTTRDAVSASLTLQRLVCLFAGIVGDPHGEDAGDVDVDVGERHVRRMLEELAVHQAHGDLLAALDGANVPPRIFIDWSPPKTSPDGSPADFDSPLLGEDEAFLPTDAPDSDAFHTVTRQELDLEGQWVALPPRAREMAQPSPGLLAGGTFKTYGSVQRDPTACEAHQVRFVASVALHKNPVRFLRSLLLVHREVTRRHRLSVPYVGRVRMRREQLALAEFLPLGADGTPITGALDAEVVDPSPTPAEAVTPLTTADDEIPFHKRDICEPRVHMPPMDHSTSARITPILVPQHQSEAAEDPARRYRAEYGMATRRRSAPPADDFTSYRQRAQAILRAAEDAEEGGADDGTGGDAVDEAPQPSLSAPSITESPPFTRFHPGEAAGRAFVHRPGVHVIARTYHMEAPIEAQLWELLWQSRVRISQLAVAMNVLNVHYESLTGSPAAAQGSDCGKEQRCMSGWYGDTVDGDDVVIAAGDLLSQDAFLQWFEDVAEQSAMAREARRVLTEAGVGYVRRDPNLSLFHFLSFVKVFCGSEAARSALESPLAPRSMLGPITPEEMGFQIVVGTETNIVDGGSFVVPWHADPATLIALLAERSVVREIQ